VAPRTQQRPTTGTGRFARSTQRPASPRPRRGSTGPRSYDGPARVLARGKGKPKQPTGAAKVLAGLTSTKGKGKSAGGIAALAGLAGLAVKNRDKLPGRLGGKRASEPEPLTTPAPATTPTTNATGTTGTPPAID
jgi:hypothetical protein